MPSTTISTVRTKSRNFSSLIRLNDPDFDKDRRRQLEYDFSDLGGGKFYGNPLTRGIYADGVSLQMGDVVVQAESEEDIEPA